MNESVISINYVARRALKRMALKVEGRRIEEQSKWDRIDRAARAEVVGAAMRRDNRPSLIALDQSTVTTTANR